jgi:hypothetical protein
VTRRHKDGSSRWAEVTATNLLLEPSVKAVLANLRDLSERKRAEDALRESEERFRTMADTAPVLIWLSGHDKLCTYVNRRWLDFTGRNLQEALGSGWATAIHPDDTEHCLQTYSAAFDRHEAFTSLPLPCLERPGGGDIVEMPFVPSARQPPADPVGEFLAEAERPLATRHRATWRPESSFRVSAGYGRARQSDAT